MSIDRRESIPTIIGGGRVLYYTRIDERHVQQGNSDKHPYGLAICEVEGSGVFLFTCKDDWMPVLDSWHTTVDEAKRQAASQFGGVASTWQRPPT